MSPRKLTRERLAVASKTGAKRRVVHSDDVLGSDGPLMGRLAGFAPRTSQQELALCVERTLADRGVFIAESGTGTGKTFAYLVPALLSGNKILISTGTKALQDQLFRRDLPLIRDALGVPVTAALLKGRANYLCRYRLKHAEDTLRYRRPEAVSDIQRVREWAGRTRSGDITELGDVAEDSEIWPAVTSTPENCLGSKCSDYAECFVNRARQEAVAAEILVVNHHLFFADLILREEGFGRLLPGMDAVIFDEAHQLPEIASNFFGVSLSAGHLLSLARDSLAEDIKERSGIPELAERARSLEKSVADLRLALGVDPGRAEWESISGRREFLSALDEVRRRLSQLGEALEMASARGPGLENCAHRASELLDRLLQVSENPPSDYVAWLETTARGFTLRLTPLNVATPFQQCMTEGERKAWIFTSATLAVADDFAHFANRLGLDAADTGLWGSPFDYARQALLYIPTGLPSPAASDYVERVVEAAVPVLEASRGRAFVLFTSHRALREASERLRGRLEYPLLVQGSMPRAALLDRFRALGNAVLLGTGSFWEGVDVRGEALSCVIIDKLPFAAPDDPVLRARAAAMEQAGQNPFMDYQLPQAVIALKQGVGRLIRDSKDHGVLVLCDPRLLTKGYGRVFLASLPPLPLTQSLDDVQRFFA